MNRWQKIIAAYNDFKIDSPRVRSILLYLFFVAISTVLWGFISFNNSMTKDFKLPVMVKAPANVTFLDSIPDTLSVQVTASGSSFIKYLFVQAPTLELDFKGSDGTYRVNSVELRKALKTLLGQSATIGTIWPENIQATYTELSPLRVPVEMNVDYTIAAGFVPSGEVQVIPDSVDVYGTAESLAKVTNIYTRHVGGASFQSVTDTIRRKVALQHMSGVVVRPAVVEIIIPVEVMVDASSTVPVELINAPDNVKANFHPATVAVKFKRPKSYDERETSARIKVIVDFNSIDLKHDKAPLKVTEWPAAYEDVVLTADSVTYTVERW